MELRASAPSNIALIKYMGKSETTGNRPANASLSYTLEHLRSFVEIQPNSLGKDTWQPLQGHQLIQLSSTGLTKFLTHFERLKTQWGITGNFTLSSANNFPSDCGLASSASSFAALTLATWELAKSQKPALDVSVHELSRLSRLGSGSSCRSLFSPWALWRDEGAEEIDIPTRLEHAVIVVEGSIKAVSSSQAHVRVNSSLLFQGRPQRAEQRLRELVQALTNSNWRAAMELCWAEFWDMHALFETSSPAFGYMTEQTLSVLSRLRRVWETTGDGPLITMDAGPNIHILLRQDQVASADGWLTGLNVIKSWGAR